MYDCSYKLSFKSGGRLLNINVVVVMYYSRPNNKVKIVGNIFVNLFAFFIVYCIIYYIFKRGLVEFTV